jgi:hypothetical protein
VKVGTLGFLSSFGVTIYKDINRQRQEEKEKEEEGERT